MTPVNTHTHIYMRVRAREYIHNIRIYIIQTRIQRSTIFMYCILIAGGSLTGPYDACDLIYSDLTKDSRKLSQYYAYCIRASMVVQREILCHGYTSINSHLVSPFSISLVTSRFVIHASSPFYALSSPLVAILIGSGEETTSEIARRSGPPNL